MTDRPMVTLIATPATLPKGRVWGTGGWIDPRDREALDWLTLVRFLGWDVELLDATTTGRAAAAAVPSRVVVLAGDPGGISQDIVARTAAQLLENPLLVLARAAREGSTLGVFAGAAATGDAITGRSIDWRGPGEPVSWRATNILTACRLVLDPESEIWATLDGAPLVVARRHGSSVVVTFAGHPSEWRGADPAGTRLITEVLTRGLPRPVAWLDFEGTLVLRMDDPGGAQNVHSRTWNYQKLGADAWRTVGAELASREARLSIGYVSGWVDDGDVARGRLTVRGSAVSRRPGVIHPSPVVRYEDLAGHAPGSAHDYVGEFEGIQELRRAGLADVELHGYTHMHPDLERWARADDRFETWPATAWYRELGPAAAASLNHLPLADHPLARAVSLFRQYFETFPTTLICPGDQWTDAALERALDLGLVLVSSFYLGIRDGDRFCWATHVCAPYLNVPDSTWFSSGLPVVGYFHDYELAQEGVKWMARWLDRWRDAGARRLIDFRELAAALAVRIGAADEGGQLTLTVRRTDHVAPVRPIPVRLWRAETLPSRVVVRSGGRSDDVAVERLSDGSGRVLVPVHLLRDSHVLGPARMYSAT